VIGGGDWSEDRIVPDAIRAWQAGAPLQVRRPAAIRPWQHVLEPLAGYLALAQVLWSRPETAGSYNFGPDPAEAASVRELVELARSAYGEGEVAYGDGAGGPHEAGLLTLDIAKARTVLGYRPKWDLRKTLDRTMAWYRKHRDGANARELCETDIAEYERTA
jgi:CDP-glucose 4,6-dehydratase